MTQFLDHHGWILRYTAAPGLVFLASVLPRLLHPKDPAKALRLGGMMASLPFIIGPILLYIAVNASGFPLLAPEQGAEAALAAAATNARGAVWGIFAYLAACSACSLACGPASRNLPRLPAALTTALAGTLAFALIARLLSWVPLPSPGYAVPLLLPLLIAFRRLPLSRGCAVLPAPARSPNLLLFLKCLAAFFLANAAIQLKELWGDPWGGIAGLFPTATGIMLISSLLQGGPSSLQHQLLGVGRGAFGLLAFLLCYGYTVTLGAPLLTWAIAIALAFTTTYLVGKLPFWALPQTQKKGPEGPEES